MRRFFYLYFIVHIMMIRMQLQILGAVAPSAAAWFAADHYIGSLMGAAAMLFPYPVLTKTLLDGIITKLFKGLGMMIAGMQAYVASPDVNAATIFFSDGPF